MGDLETAGLSDSRTQIVNEELLRESDNVDFLDVSVVLAQRWRMIVATSLVMLIAGALISLLIPISFTATAVILPPQQQQSVASAMGAQLGALSALSGGGSNIFKNPADMYAGILQSRTIADQLIETFHLKSLYKVKTLDDARASLKGQSAFEASKDGLITITVIAHDPHLASDLANGYVDALHALNSTLATTEAAQRRVFFDQELVSEKNALADAENDLKNTQQKTGLIELSGQATEIIRSLAQVRAEIASREVQLQALKTFATDQNPETIRLQEEINTLRGQLAKLENSPGAMSPGDINVPTGKVPEATLEYARRLREVRYHESLYALLSNQYEAARIDEAKSVPLIQIIDRAVPPEKKSGPHRSLIALGSAVCGFLGACIWILVQRGFHRIRQVPRNAERLQELGRAFGPRS